MDPDQIELRKYQFFKNLNYPIYVGNNKRIEKYIKISDRDSSIHWKYIGINSRYHIKYLAFDLDYHLSSAAWLEAGLPEPSIIIRSPDIKRRTTHLLYELKSPVLLPVIKSKKPISMRPIRFARRIRYTYNCLMAGDIGFNNRFIKNPLNPYWITTFHGHSYTLRELTKNKKIYHIPFELYQDDAYGRHMTMFDVCRKEAYKYIRDNPNWTEDIFTREVHKMCLKYYNINLKESIKPHPFPISEAESISRSISRWSYANREKIIASQYKKLSKEEFKKAALKRGKATGKMRREKTIKFIGEVLQNLKDQNIEYNLQDVIKHTKLSQSVIYRYRKHFDY